MFLCCSQKQKCDMKACLKSTDILSDINFNLPVKIGDEKYHFLKEVDPRLFDVKNYKFENFEFLEKKHCCHGIEFKKYNELTFIKNLTPRQISESAKSPPICKSSAKKIISRRYKLLKIESYENCPKFHIFLKSEIWCLSTKLN